MKNLITCHTALLILTLALSLPVSAQFKTALLQNEINTEHQLTCHFHLYNTVANATAYALLMNGSRTGMGTTNPTGSQMQPKNLYDHLNDIASLADYHFSQQIKSPDTPCLPTDVILQSSSFPEQLLEQFDRSDDLISGKVNQALNILFPEFPIPSLRHVPIEQLKSKDSAISGRKLKHSAFQGIDYRLKQIQSTHQIYDGLDFQQHLKAMSYAFQPLSARIHLNLPQHRTAGKLNATLLLPAIHQLKYDDFEDVESWSLEKGVVKTEFPVPIKVSLAKITHFDYLPEPSRHQLNQTIKVNISKHLMRPNQFQAQITFGRLINSAQQLDVSHINHDDVLRLYVKLQADIKERDYRYVKMIKKQFNRITKSFDIEVFVHQLGLKYSRQKPSTPTIKKIRLRPQYLADKSRLTFKVNKETNHWLSYYQMRTAGFTCGKGLQKRWRCHKKFKTWGDLLSSTAGKITMLLVNRYMPDIETVVSEEIDYVLNETLEQLAEIRELLSERLLETAEE